MYEVLVERRAVRELRALPAVVYDRVARALKGLAREPRPPGCRKLAGSDRDWRIRIGDYRAVYEIDDTARVVRVMVIRHRRDAYR